jgi:hypothetical protein
MPGCTHSPPWFLQALKLSSVTPLYNLKRFALKPLGGSVVMLMPRCNKEVGKSCEGLDDSHSLKRSCGLDDSKSSVILSNVGSQLVVRWQLARNTQWPCLTPSSISR